METIKALTVSMESGLEGRNNLDKLHASIRSKYDVSMESGLEGRNNLCTYGHN